MSETVLILGATSAIARATAVAFAARGNALCLASQLQRFSKDVRLRYGVEVRYPHLFIVVGAWLAATILLIA